MTEVQTDKKTRVIMALIFGPAAILMALMLIFVIWNAKQDVKEVTESGDSSGYTSAGVSHK